ncbi:MAG: hypothetical protein K2X91_05115, partial [Thermoleophilia bacterium]|nr:hypothetical protein [Thermoleophilia bacterium]
MTDGKGCGQRGVVRRGARRGDEATGDEVNRGHAAPAERADRLLAVVKVHLARCPAARRKDLIVLV